MAGEEIYESMIQSRGAAYRENQIKPHSHYRDPIDHSPARHAGNSHVWGDASAEAQSRVIDALITASENAGLSTRATAHVLAIARVESGFNPDAAAGTTSAHGLGQFIDRTGEHYGINDSNRGDVNKQAKALVSHYLDNAALAKGHGQDEEYIYKYHHDGPKQDYGGLAISQQNVMPYLDQYELFVQQQQLKSHPLHELKESAPAVSTPARAHLLKPSNNRHLDPGWESSPRTQADKFDFDHVPAHHPDHALFISIRNRLPAGTTDEMAAHVALEAKIGGIKAGGIERFEVRNGHACMLGMFPGDRAIVNLNAPAPSIQETLQRSQSFDQQQTMQLAQQMEQQRHVEGRQRNGPGLVLG